MLRISNHGARRTGIRRGFVHKVAAALLSTLMFWGAVPMAQGQTGGAVSTPGADNGGDENAFNFSDQSISLEQAAARDGEKSALQNRTAPVSASGALEHVIPIHTPPGPRGMQPSIALHYSSDTFRQDSEVGAGWSLSVPSIRRSTRNGFPKLEESNGALQYPISARYEGPTGELVAFADAGGLASRSRGAVVFGPRRERAPVRYEYLPTGDRWVEHLPSGVKRFYGALPPTSPVSATAPGFEPNARVRNELGTHQWLLIREEDTSGNTVDYAYHHIDEQDRGAQDSSAWSTPQAKPVLRWARWGGNPRARYAHPFAIRTTIRDYRGTLDMLRGHIRLSSAIEEIQVTGPTFGVVGPERVSGPVGQTMYRRYRLDLTPSTDTGRLLLRSVREEFPASSTAPIVTRLDYTDNQNVDAFWGPRVPLPGLPSGVYQEWSFSGRDFVPPHHDTSGVLTPLSRRAGYRFSDIDRDGDLDVTYHPAGLKTPVARVAGEHSFRQIAPGRWQPLGPNGTGYPSRLLVRALADIDRDLAPEALSFPLVAYYQPVGGGTARRSVMHYDFDLPVEIGRLCESRGFDPDEGSPSGPIVRLPPGGGRACPDPLPPFVADSPDIDTLIQPTTIRPTTTRPTTIRPSTVRPSTIRPTIDVGGVPTLDPNVRARFDGLGNRGRPAGLMGYVPPQLSDPIGSPRQSPGSQGSPGSQSPTVTRDPALPASLSLVDPNDIERAHDYICSEYCQNPFFWLYCADNVPGGAPAGLPNESRIGTWLETSDLVSQIGQTPLYSVDQTRAYWEDFDANHRSLMSLGSQGRPIGPVNDNALGCPRQNIPPICGMAQGFCSRADACDTRGAARHVENILVARRGPGTQTWTPEVRVAQILGWPRGLQPTVELKPECDDRRVRGAEIRARPMLDFHAPTVDLNADGRADIALLKVMRERPTTSSDFDIAADQTLSTSFVPAAYKSHESGNFEIDGLRNPQPDSDFTGSLRTIFGADENDWECFASEDRLGCEQSRRYPSIRNFHAQLLDVNADGLPDLVAANAPAFSTWARICGPGHSVYLNRGYRFDVDAAESAQTAPDATWSSPDARYGLSQDHPLSLMQNRDGACQNGSFGFTDLGSDIVVPPSSAAMADINADGRVDVLVAHRATRQGSQPGIIRELYLNTSNGFVHATATNRLPLRLKSSHIPSDFVLGVGDPNARTLNRPLAASDLGRVVDVDGDGLVDLVYPSLCDGSALRPARCSNPVMWRRNQSRIPDLLTRVRRSGGATLEADYLSATSPAAKSPRPGGALPVIQRQGELPAGKIVVAAVRRARRPSSGAFARFGRAGVEAIELSYDHFVREQGSSAAVGFERVVTRFRNVRPDGSVGGTRTRTVRYDVQPSVETVDGTTAPVFHPLKGSWVERIDTDGTTTVTERRDYYVRGLDTNASRNHSNSGNRSASPTAAVRIRPRTTFRAECVAGRCAWSADVASNFDEYGYARTDTEGNAASSSAPAASAGPDAQSANRVRQDADRVDVTRTYTHHPDRWQLGLVSEQRLTGSRMDIQGSFAPNRTLSHRYARFDDRGRVTQRAEVVGEGDCIHAGARAITEVRRYSALGLPELLVDGSGRRHIDIVYGHSGLYPREVVVRAPNDGRVPTLRERYVHDPRDGARVWSQGVNGETFGTARDGRGRPLFDYGPSSEFGSGGVLLRAHTYADPETGPAAITTETYTTAGQSFATRAFLDGGIFDSDASGGNGVHAGSAELARVERFTGPSRTELRRTKRTVYDGFGQPIVDYLPRAVSSLDDVSLNQTGLAQGEAATTYAYDGFGRPTHVTRPNGTAMATTYSIDQDRGHRVTTLTNARGFVTQRYANLRGDIVRTERYGDARSGSRQSLLAAYDFVRDGLGRIAQVIDGDGFVRRLEYGLGGKVRRATLPHQPGAAGSPYAYCHDIEGDLVRVNTPAGRETRITRDYYGRPIAIQAGYHDPSFGPTTQRTVLRYDEAPGGQQGAFGLGRLTGIEHASGSWSYGYDAFGRRTFTGVALSDEIASALPPGVPSAYSVDQSFGLLGQPLRTTYGGITGPHQIVFAHDGLGRVNFVAAEDGQDARTVVHQANYDVHDRLVFAELGNEVQVGWFYDRLGGYLTDLSFASRGDVFAGSTYPLANYDENGNPRAESHFSPGERVDKRHVFDALDRLVRTDIDVSSGADTSRLTEDFAYSSGGNVHRAADQIYTYTRADLAQAATHVGTRALRYDEDGWLQEDRRSDSDIRALTFDGTGCLRHVSGPRASTDHLCGPDGSRLWRSTLTSDSQGASQSRMLSLPGGVEIRPDEDLLLIQIPVGTQNISEIAWSLSTGEWRPDESGFLHTDVRGSVLAKTRMDAPSPDIATQKANYDAWGNASTANQTPLPIHQYLASEPDPVDGYYHLGVRPYDPTLRRWLAPDPLLITQPELDTDFASQLNLYSYSANNPVSKRDRGGAYFESVIDATSLAIGIQSIRSWDEHTSLTQKILDVGGVALDAAALAAPAIPGGISAAIKAAKAGDKAADAVTKTNQAAQAAQSARQAAREAAERAAKRDTASSAAQNASNKTPKALKANNLDQLSKQAQKSVRSFEKLIVEHREKLEAFKRNPGAFDNKGFLRDAPSLEVRQRIINGRIRHLEDEIRNFEQQIQKLIRRGD